MQLHEYDYFATCPKGLEEQTLNEINEHIEHVKAHPTKGGVYFSCSLIPAIEYLFQARIASRIFRKVKTFKVKFEDDFTENTKKVNWSEIFTTEQTFKVEVTRSVSEKLKKPSKFKNSIYLALKIKDGIVDSFGEKRPDVDTKDPDILIRGHMYPEDDKSFKERVILMVDLCGDPLSNRGFRGKIQHKAPMRENSAAAIIDELDWQQDQEVFCDFMCGTGTFLFEALVKKLKISPQFLQIKDRKTWAFENQRDLKGHKKKFLALKKNLLDEALEKIQKANFRIYGCDIAFKVTEELKEQIQRLELDNILKVSKKNATMIVPEDFSEKSAALFFANAPYGVRLQSQMGQLEDLYFKIGDNLKLNFDGSRLGVLSESKELLGKVPLRPFKKYTINSGGLNLRLHCYQIGKVDEK
jgi:23S rRNA G2445 N2-methylase RlmL